MTHLHTNKLRKSQVSAHDRYIADLFIAVGNRWGSSRAVRRALNGSANTGKVARWVRCSSPPVPPPPRRIQYRPTHRAAVSNAEGDEHA
jgi:hypothetical protein